MDDSLNLLDDIIAAARKAGADEADVAFVERRSTKVQCRDGALENTGRSESSSLSLRVFVGRQVATLSSSNLDKNAIASLVDQTVAVARKAPESPEAGLVVRELLAKDQDQDLDLDMWDDCTLDAEALFADAQKIESAALAVAHIERSAGASASAGDARMAVRTTNGFSGVAKRTAFGRACGAVAANANGKEVGHEHSSAIFLGDLSSGEDIGKAAGTRAAKKLGGQKIKTGQFPVVFAPEISNSFLGVLADAISGPTVASGMSFLKDRLGEQIFGNGIQVFDDPHRKRGLGSRIYDGEGVATRRIELVNNGVLTSWLLNNESAKKLGCELTGHSRPLGQSVNASNLYMAAGALSPDEIMADIEFGFYVTDQLGHGPNGVTGDYSQGAAGFLIENGKITTPVKEATIAGTLKDMFMNMSAADDLAFKFQVNAPTLRVDGMTVAGE